MILIFLTPMTKKRDYRKTLTKMRLIKDLSKNKFYFSLAKKFGQNRITFLTNVFMTDYLLFLQLLYFYPFFVFIFQKIMSRMPN